MLLGLLNLVHTCARTWQYGLSPALELLKSEAESGR